MDQAAPEVVTEEVPVETAETPVVPAGDTAKPEGAEVVKPGDEKTFTQKELDEIVAKRLARDRKARANEQAQQRPAPQAPAVEAAPDPAAPKREAYDDYEAYIEAKAAYVAEQTFKTQRAAEQKAANEAKEQQEQHAAMTAFGSQMDAAIAKYPDFEDAEAIARQLPITDAMFNAMIRLDEGADLVYFFGKNPAEAQRIAQLHPTRQAAEIGKLAAKLPAAPTPAKPASVSKAPAPIEPVGGNVTASDKPPDDPDEYLRWHNAQLRAKAAGRRT